MPLAAPVRKQRLPVKPLPCPMAVTLPSGLRRPTAPSATAARAPRRRGGDLAPRPTNALSCVNVIAVVAVSIRTSAGRSSEIGRAPASCSTRPTILSITVSSKSFIISRIWASVFCASGAGPHHRVVTGEHRRRAADHALGECLRRLVGLARREVMGELVEFRHRLGQHHREHRVFGVEVEVEARTGDAGPLADRADRQIGERPLLQQLTHRGHDGVALPVAPAATDLRVRIRRSWL